MKHKVTTENFKEVLKTIEKQFDNEDKEGKKIWASDLNSMLDTMSDDDFFGTEGQCDPRGDQRD